MYLGQFLGRQNRPKPDLNQPKYLSLVLGNTVLQV